MAAFDICHRSCHNVYIYIYIEEFSSMKCHLTLFYKDEEPLPSD